MRRLCIPTGHFQQGAAVALAPKENSPSRPTIVPQDGAADVQGTLT